ncbi:MAG: hypothetical protein AAGD17_06980 [Bacteroidota bacterium]
MKKLILILLTLTVYSCNEKYCGFVDGNKEALNELVQLIKKNPSEFFNNNSKPRVYYTYNYQKEEVEFRKTSQSRTISSEEYKSLKRIFKELSIEEFLIYNDQNLLFKVNNTDFFVSDFGFYLGYLNEKSYDDISKDLDILEFDACEDNWYYILQRTSIAN